MRTTLLFLVLCLLLCTGCSVQKVVVPSDLSNMGLRGKIESIRQIPYNRSKEFKQLVIGEEWPYLESNFYISFDEKGNMLEKRLYNSKDQYYSQRIYKYDETGNRTKEILYYCNSRYTSIITYEYNKKRDIVESKYDSGLDISFIYKYDGDGNRVETKKYYGNGNLYFRSQYKYNDKGERIQVKVYTADNSLFSRWIFRYDQEGNMIEKKRYLANDNFDCRITYKYDEEGNRVSWESYDSNGNLESSGKYQYEYDNRGNWISRTVTKGNEPTYVLNREIDYFHD